MIAKAFYFCLRRRTELMHINNEATIPTRITDLSGLYEITPCKNYQKIYAWNKSA